jgi:hypothetical protein
MNRLCLVAFAVLFAATASAADLKFAIYPMSDPQKLLPPHAHPNRISEHKNR